MAAACAPDLPTGASHTLARPGHDVRSRGPEAAPATCTLSNGFNPAAVNCQVMQVWPDAVLAIVTDCVDPHLS